MPSYLHSSVGCFIAAKCKPERSRSAPVSLNNQPKDVTCSGPGANEVSNTGEEWNMVVDEPKCNHAFIWRVRGICSGVLGVLAASLANPAQSVQRIVRQRPSI